MQGSASGIDAPRRAGSSLNLYRAKGSNQPPEMRQSRTHRTCKYVWFLSVIHTAKFDSTHFDSHNDQGNVWACPVWTYSETISQTYIFTWVNNIRNKKLFFLTTRYTAKLLFKTIFFQLFGGFISFLFPRLPDGPRSQVAKWHAISGKIIVLLAILTAINGVARFYRYMYINTVAQVFCTSVRVDVIIQNPTTLL